MTDTTEQSTPEAEDPGVADGPLASEDDADGFEQRDPWLAEFEGEKELAHAEALMKQNLFGATARRRWPFSRQLRDEIKRSFPVDKDSFHTVDATYSEIRRVTLIAFGAGTVAFGFVLLLFSGLMLPLLSQLATDGAPSAPPAFVAWLWSQGDAVAPPAWANGLVLWQYLSIMLAGVAIFGFCARFLARLPLNHRIVNSAQKLDFTITQTYKDILARVETVSGKIHYARAQDDWPRRAYLWTIIAQWNIKRAEYIDRYFSTISWKIDLFNRYVEWSVIIIRTAMILASAGFVLAWLFGAGADPLRATLWTFVTFAGFFVYFVIVWVLIGRKSNNLWNQTSVQTIQEFERGHVHEYRELAQVVQTLVKTIIDFRPQYGQQ